VLYDQMAMGVAYHDAEAESHGLWVGRHGQKFFTGAES
jgi:hypothetical protein